MSGETLSLSTLPFFSLSFFFFGGGGGKGVRKKIGELTLFPAFFCLGVFLFCHHIIKEMSD